VATRLPVGPTPRPEGAAAVRARRRAVAGVDVLPFRVTVMGLTGRTTGARTHGDPGPQVQRPMLQLDYVPKLPLVSTAGLQIMRNQRQAVAGRPDDYGTKTSSWRSAPCARADVPLRVVAGAHVWRQTIKQVRGHERDASATVIGSHSSSERRAHASHNARRSSPPHCRRTRARWSPVPANHRRRGACRQVYERYCIQCHGARGDAQESRRWSHPKPRDFPKASTSLARRDTAPCPRRPTRPG